MQLIYYALLCGVCCSCARIVLLHMIYLLHQNDSAVIHIDFFHQIIISSNSNFTPVRCLARREIIHIRPNCAIHFTMPRWMNYYGFISTNEFALNFSAALPK